MVAICVGDDGAGDVSVTGEEVARRRIVRGLELGRGTRELSLIEEMLGISAAGPESSRGRSLPSPEAKARLEALVEALESGGPDVAWLVLAILGGNLPTDDSIREFRRSVTLDGAAVVLQLLLRRRRFLRPAAAVSGTILVAAARWNRAGALLTHDGLRAVPWNATIVITEPIEARVIHERVAALVARSRSRSVAVSDGTTRLSLPADAAQAALYLALAQRVGTVAATSEAAARQLRGWAAMLPSAGLHAPAIAVLRSGRPAELAELATRPA